MICAPDKNVIESQLKCFGRLKLSISSCLANKYLRETLRYSERILCKSLKPMISLKIKTVKNYLKPTIFIPGLSS